MRGLESWIVVEGTLVEGHGVASGMAGGRYARGTIAMQLPRFRQRGLDLTGFFPGTLNVSLHPHVLRLHSPRHTFRSVWWSPDDPPEDFSFSLCAVLRGCRRYAAYVYAPHPETKPRHHQAPSIVEVITSFLPGLAYGDAITLAVDAREVRTSIGDAASHTGPRPRRPLADGTGREP